MSRQSKQELDFLSNMLQNNPMFAPTSLSPRVFQGPDYSYMRPSEIPQIARRLENCGSAANYLDCFRSGKSNQNNKSEMICKACEDFCGNKKKEEQEQDQEDQEEEMVSGFVGSGVFLQLQAGSSPLSNFSTAVQPISNTSSWQETWNNKCQNKMPKPYQFIH